MTIMKTPPANVARYVELRLKKVPTPRTRAMTPTRDAIIIRRAEPRIQKSVSSICKTLKK